MSKKEQIIKDFSERKLNLTEIAKKHDVSLPYISQLNKIFELQEKVKILDRILAMVKKKALKAYKDKMTEEEREFWQTL